MLQTSDLTAISRFSTECAKDIYKLYQYCDRYGHSGRYVTDKTIQYNPVQRKTLLAGMRYINQ